MRYFFEPELQAFLLAMPDSSWCASAVSRLLDEEPSEHTWNVAFVARAR